MDANKDPVRALVAKWRRQAAEHGTRTFTGNDHAMFANELEAALAQQARAKPVAYVDLANWHDGLSADECFFTDWQDDDTVPLYLTQQPAAPRCGKTRHELDAYLWLRESTQEWVLEITSAINDTHSVSRYTAPASLSPEEAIGYAITSAPQQLAAVDGKVMVQASDLKTLAEFADRGMRGNPAKLAALRAKAILAAQQQG